LIQRYAPFPYTTLFRSRRWLTRCGPGLTPPDRPPNIRPSTYRPMSEERTPGDVGGRARAAVDRNAGDFGSTLRAARERKGISLRDRKSTRLNSSHDQIS